MSESEEQLVKENQKPEISVMSSILDLGLRNIGELLYYRRNIKTVSDLISHSPNEVLGISGIGQKSLGLIREKLASLGLHLKGDEKFLLSYQAGFGDLGNSEKTTSVDPDKIDSISIYDCGIPGYIAFDLSREGNIKTFSDLISYSPNELLRIKGMTIKKVTIIQKKLTSLGLKLKNPEEHEIPNMSIYHLGVIDNAMWAYEGKIETVSDLISYSPKELLKIKGMGSKKLSLIQEKLASLGLHLKGDEEFLLNYQNASQSSIPKQEGIIEDTVQPATSEESEPQTENETETETPSTVLEQLRAAREELARELEKLKAQTKSAEELLASYDRILTGSTQDKNVKGE